MKDVKLTDSQLSILIYCLDEKEFTTSHKETLNKDFIKNLKKTREILYKARKN